MARSVLSLTWELVARVVTTFFLFGVVETVSFGSSALSSKMLLVRIVENNKIDAFLEQEGLIKG